MSLWRKISLIFLSTLLLLIITLMLVLTTSVGIRFALHQVAGFVPGLHIEQVEGNLRNLTLSRIKYEMEGVNVDVADLSLALDFSCLTHSRICVSQLAAKGVEVIIDTSKFPETPVEQENSEPLTDLITPYPIELHTLVLDNIHVDVDGIKITAANLSSGAHWQQRLITLLPTTVHSLVISLPQTTSEPETTQSEPLGQMLQELFSKPLLERLPQVVIPVDVTVKEIDGQDVRLTMMGETIVAQQVVVQGKTQGPDINLETFKVVTSQGTAGLIGSLSLKDNWPVALTLNSALNIDSLRGQRVRLQLDGDIVGDLKLSLNLSGPVSAQLDAQASLAQAELPLSLTLESQRVQWPVSGNAEYRADNLRLRLTGKATDYVLSLRADLSGAEIPPAQLIFDGRGNTQQFNLSRMRLTALQGRAELSGVADWSRAVSWNAILTAEGIDTAQQWPQWPATLQGRLSTRGSVYGGSWQLDMPDINFTGSVKQQRLSVIGSVRGNAAGQWRIPSLVMALGNNHVEVKGELMNNWAMDADIAFPDPNSVMPGLRGAIGGQIKLRGNQRTPQLITDLTATQLKWQDISLEKATVNGNIQSAAQVSGDLNVAVTQLVQGDTRIKSITLTATGNERNHELLFNADGKPLAGHFILRGNFDRTSERWQGTLSETRFDTPLGAWHVSPDVALDYRHTQKRTTIGTHCWLNNQAEICLSRAAQVGASGQVSVELKRFELAILKGVLSGTDLQGGFTGDADFSWSDNNQLPQGKIALTGHGVKITEPVNNSRLPVAFDNINLNADISSQNVKLDWLLKLADNGKFNGNVLVSDPQNSRRLSGDILLDHLSLELLKPILGRNEKAQGILNGHLRLAGNSKAPQILGHLDLTEVVLDTQWSPITVTQGDVKLQFNGLSSLLDGQIKTPRGELALNGNADWRNIDAWRASVAAKGNRIRIEMPPTVQLDISPDIVFEATPSLLTLNGTVAIPWARITVEELPDSAVGISSDEVILDNNLQPVVAQSAAIPIRSDLSIKIGPDVSLDAFGLKTTLLGDLKVLQDAKGLGLHGEVKLPSGSFRAYGQDLLIRQGTIIFAGPPELPQLDIDAIRNPEATEDGVTAGLRVTGLADQPRVEIYSDPALSQEEALSYLLRGRGLEASSDDNSMMTSMLIGIGVAQSGQVVGKIGETFGVKDLSLDTQGVGDSSQVVVSGHILPGLQIKYGVGIFDSLATLTLRYRLMPRLYLEAVSGLDQALDILYQFEF